MQTTARALPSGLTRYTGTAPIGAIDAAGNVFHAFQGPNDTGLVVMVEPGGHVAVVPTPPIKGRPGLLCDPFQGLWVLGNKEASDRSTPPLYPVAAFVVRGVAPGGGPVPTEDAAAIAEFGSEAWPNYGQPYPDETLITDGRWHLRANKIVGLLVQLARAVAQLQRLARARGELR